MKPNTDVKMLSPSTKARASTVARSKDLHGSVNSFQGLFERQKRHFATGATRSYA